MRRSSIPGLALFFFALGAIVCFRTFFPNTEYDRANQDFSSATQSLGPCLSWRALMGCEQEGQRDPNLDTDCEAVIPQGQSGYCQCLENNSRNIFIPCAHRDVSCHDVCDTSVDFEGGSKATASQPEHEPQQPQPRHEQETKDHKQQQQQQQQHGEQQQEQPPPPPQQQKEEKQQQQQQSQQQSPPPPPPPQQQQEQQQQHQQQQQQGEQQQEQQQQQQQQPQAQQQANDEPRCQGWHQTAGCDPHGPRESDKDSPCTEKITSGRSGYCACEGNRKESLVGCGHSPFTCQQKCLVAKPITAPNAVVNESSPCVGWQQTGDCSPWGEREPESDQPCTATIVSDWSGYCLCRGGEHRGRFECHHDPFTCDVLCAGPTPNTPLTASALELTPSSDSSRIPKIIHQTWRSANVQGVFKPYIESWLRLHPDWQYYFWNDDDNNELVARHYRQYLEMFRRYNGWARNVQRADVIRYFILHRYGGVYVDLDFEALRPLDSLLQRDLCVIGAEPVEHAAVLYDLDVMVCNAFMASAPRHPFWNHVFEELQKRSSMVDPVQSTGPRMLQHSLSVSSSSGAVRVMPPRFLYPRYDPYAEIPAKCNDHRDSTQRKRKMCDELRKEGFHNTAWQEAFAEHHWSHTWLGLVKDVTLVHVPTLVQEASWKTALDFEPRTGLSESIEHIVHHVWPSGDVVTSAKDWYRSWALTHPDWDHVMWSQKQLQELLSKHPSLSRLIGSGSVPLGVWQAVACVAVVVSRGGLCVAMETQALRPLDVLVDSLSLLVSLVPQPSQQQSTPSLTISPHIIGALRGHPVLSATLDSLSGLASVQTSDITGTLTLEVYKHTKATAAEGVMPAWVLHDSQPNSFATLHPHTTNLQSEESRSHVLGSLPHGWREAFSQ